MADPRAAGDARGEWFEVHNRGRGAVSLRGWTIRSGNDRPHRIAAAVVVPADGYVVLGRDANARANGGVRPGYAYGAGISFANGSDWVALDDARGAAIDSVAWRRATAGVSWELGDESAVARRGRGPALAPRGDALRRRRSRHPGRA